jgi:hypothetical protein
VSPKTGKLPEAITARPAEGSLATPSGADLDPYVLWLRLRSHRGVPQEVVMEDNYRPLFGYR